MSDAVEGLCRCRAVELRQVRTRSVPPGTACGSSADTGLIVRLPDGTGWRGAGHLASDLTGWAWPPHFDRLTYVIARGLSDERCRQVLREVADLYKGLDPATPSERAELQARLAAYVAGVCP